MKILYTPQSGAELLVIRGLLIAHQIPHGMSGGHGSVLPGMLIYGYNTQTIWVPDSAFEDAQALVEDFLSQPEVRFSRTSGTTFVRMVLEALFFGWVVPFREVKIEEDASNHSLKADGADAPPP